MRRPSALLACAAALLAPAAAWACGSCADNLIRTSAWYGPWPAWALVALFVDAVGFALYAKIRLPKPQKKGGLLALLIAGGALLLGAGYLGLYASAAIAAAVLLVKAIRSRGRLSDRSPRERTTVLAVRLASAAAIVALFVARSVPSAVPSETLLSNLLYKGPRLEPPGWSERELKRRSDLPTVTARLDREVAASSQLLSPHAVHLLRLHEFMGGPAAARQAGCDLGRARRDVQAGAQLAKACGEPPPPD